MVLTFFVKSSYETGEGAIMAWRNRKVSTTLLGEVKEAGLDHASTAQIGASKWKAELSEYSDRVELMDGSKDSEL
jgi:hypothetical protein